VPILQSLSKYQDLVHESAIVSVAFVEGSLGALRSHKEAQEIFQEAENEGDLADGLAELVGCAKMAGRMEKKAEELEMKTDELIKLTELGLTQAKHDMNNNAEDSKKFDAEINKMNADQEGRKAKRQMLQAELEEATQKELKAALDASDARSKQFTMDIIGVVSDGLKTLNPATQISNSVSGVSNAVSGALQRAGGQDGGMGAGSSQRSGTQQTIENDGDLAAAKKEAMNAKSQLESTKMKLSQAKVAPDHDQKDGKELIAQLEGDLQKQQSATEAAEANSSRLSEALEKRAVTLEAKEAKASQYRREINKETTEVASAIAKSIEELKTMKFQKSHAEQVYTLLLTTLQTMAMVKTTFANTKDFWKQVKESCNRLANFQEKFEEKVQIVMKKMADGGKIDRPRKALLAAVQESAIGWAGIGRICFDAAEACESAKKNVDNVMKNGLGDKDEAVKGLVEKLGLSMQKKLKNSAA